MYAAIMVRGLIGAGKDEKMAMRLMRLNKQNHLVLLPENSSAQGTLEKVKSYITYGKIANDVLAELVEKWARLQGDKRIDGNFLKANKFSSVKGLADALIGGKISLDELQIKPVFRLHAPIKGYERLGTKKQFAAGGALGPRGDEINKLILRMI